MSADNRVYAPCPVCHSIRRVNKDGTIRKHMRDMSTHLAGRTIYRNEWCDGGGQPAPTKPGGAA